MRKIQVRLTAAAAAALIAAGTMALPAAAAQCSIRESADIMVQSERKNIEMLGASADDDYLLPDSDTYYITESDVSWMDDNELMLARNEFYARRGRKFVTKSIRDYFNSKSWYRGRIEPDDFRADMFNRYEQANVDFIVAYENSRKQVREQKKKQKEKKKQEEASIEMIGGSDSTADAASDGYDEIMELYSDAVRQGWPEEDYETAGINSIVSDLEDPEELGYIFRDLDEDGSAELMLGPVDPRMYGEGAVFGIYTLEDGLPVTVVESDENAFCYVCSDNTICRQEILPDGRWAVCYYDLIDGILVCKDVLVMDEDLDEEEPWFVIENVGELQALAAEEEEEYAYEDEWQSIPKEEYRPISYEEASEYRAAYVADVLDLTPLK